MITGALIGLLAAAGCGKKAGGSATEAPGAEAGMDATYADDGSAEAEAGPVSESIDELEAELLGYEDGLLASGVDLPEEVKQARVDLGASAGTPATDGLDDAARCERICTLATSICGLRDQICALADEHTNEPRYLRACERATQDCDRAQGACDDCGE